MTPNKHFRHLGGISREYSYSMQEALQRAAQSADGDQQRREILVSITLAVSMVETFWNALAQRLILLPQYEHARKSISDSLHRPFPLKRKLDQWPAVLFGKRFDSQSREVQRFHDVRELRNALMHFRGEPGVLNLAGQGILMTDTTVYDQLTLAKGVEAANAAWGVIKYFLSLVHPTDRETEIEMHYWTGTRAVTNVQSQSTRSTE